VHHTHGDRPDTGRLADHRRGDDVARRAARQRLPARTFRRVDPELTNRGAAAGAGLGDLSDPVKLFGISIKREGRHVMTLPGE
jgi:hypothetical protein